MPIKNEDRLENLWPDDEHPDTVYGAISPILQGIGDIAHPAVEMINGNLGLIPGDLGLSLDFQKLAAKIASAAGIAFNGS